MEIQVDKPFILCVDDEKLVLNSLKEQLQHYLGNSCTIELAESGYEALEIIDDIFTQQKIRPALIISDQIMPNMKGHELLAEVKSISPQTLAILLTGQAQMCDLIALVNQGGLYRYISKPWDMNDLFLTVKEALISHKAQQDIKQMNDHLRILNKNLEEKVNERTVEIQVQSKELKKRNYQFKQSLVYASRIQKAILPTTSELGNFMKDHYVFYSPKGIVSGDFYFLYEVNDVVLLGVADCTGHGVPGALLSMMSSNILTEIIEREITSPSEILNQLHVSLVSALSQDENDLEDGLDIGLVQVDTRKKTISFSGARSNLLIKQNNDLQEINGNRISIGGELKVKREFKTHHFTYSEDTSFFLYTDGLTDQFGGEKDKKFGRHQLKCILKKHDSNNPQKIGLCVKEKLNDWMNGYEQTDDITFIGFKPN